MREKLTASFIERLKCPDSKTQFKVFDSEVSGLAVRVTKNGIKTFIFERRPKLLLEYVGFTLHSSTRLHQVRKQLHKSHRDTDHEMTNIEA